MSNFGNIVGHCAKLNDAAGEITNGSQIKTVFGVALLAETAGNIVVTGIVDANGAPAAWTITAGSTGFATPPGAGVCTDLRYSCANAADAGKAVIAWAPR